MRTFLRAMFFAASCFTGGCDDVTAQRQSEFAPTHGLILISEGHIENIRFAILEYDTLVKAVVPQSFIVEIHPQSDGTTAIVAPGGLPAYDFANLAGWLNAPPNQAAVRGAVVWMEAPGDGERYYLEPDQGNPWADTIIGTSMSGRRVRVALPEAAVFRAENSVVYRERPAFVSSPSPTSIVLTLDANTNFGNPAFVPHK